MMEGTEGTERCAASTSTIIEEIRALAKSMLESTEAVRQKSQYVENCKTYDALLSVLGSTPLTKRSTTSQKHQSHSDPNGIFPSGTDEFSSCTTTDRTDFNNCRVQKVLNDDANFCETELDDAEVENASTVQDGYECPSTAGAFCSMTKGSNTNKIITDFSADSDENVYDGVRTQVVFKAVDPGLYQDISSCTWQPEPLLLHPETGETVEDDSEDKDDIGSDYENDMSVMGSKKIYRVPSFPFGGGITEGQARFLSRTFFDTINRGGLATSTRPIHISTKDFIEYKYTECATTEAERSRFKPSSPFEFVVELERGVIFDAVRARESRRKEFRRLAEEGKAPITMGSFNLRVIMDPLKTGFEEEKTFPIERGTIIADRYQIVELLGKATFSRAVRCYDLYQPIYEDDEECNEREKDVLTDGQSRTTDAEGSGEINNLTKRK
ncbi:unnamed protein product, partial [Trypanosoma congolense IL3000]